MTMRDVATLLSSAGQSWRTPPHIYQWLHGIYDFDLDACADDENHLCDRYYTEETDGLTSPWTRPDGTPYRVFANPCYGRDAHGRSLQAGWFYKAVAEAANGVTSVLLVPARTDTVWFQECVPKAIRLWFLRGRIAFLNERGERVSSGTFPSAVIEFGPPPRADAPTPYVSFVTPPRR